MYAWVWPEIGVSRGPAPLLQTFVAGPLLQTLVAGLGVDDCSLQEACHRGVYRKTPQVCYKPCRKKAAGDCHKPDVLGLLSYVTYTHSPTGILDLSPKLHSIGWHTEPLSPNFPMQLEPRNMVDKGPKGHINTRILQAMVSGILLDIAIVFVPGVVMMCDPCAYGFFGNS